MIYDFPSWFYHTSFMPSTWINMLITKGLLFKLQNFCVHFMVKYYLEHFEDTRKKKTTTSIQFPTRKRVLKFVFEKEANISHSHWCDASFVRFSFYLKDASWLACHWSKAILSRFFFSKNKEGKERCYRIGIKESTNWIGNLK